MKRLTELGQEVTKHVADLTRARSEVVAVRMEAARERNKVSVDGLLLFLPVLILA